MTPRVDVRAPEQIVDLHYADRATAARPIEPAPHLPTRAQRTAVSRARAGATNHLPMPSRPMTGHRIRELSAAARFQLDRLGYDQVAPPLSSAARHMR